MKIKVVAYKDTKLNIFTQPMYLDGSASDSDIIEMTRRMCANPSFNKSMFEYDLYSLGLFDDKLGKFEVHDPEFLVSLADFRHLASEEKAEKVDVVG